MAIKKYINTTEAAELTGCSYDEILKLAKEGVLPSHKTRRGHYRLNVEAVERCFGIQINEPEEEGEGEEFSPCIRLITGNFYEEVVEPIRKAKKSVRIMTADFKHFRMKPGKGQGKNYGDGTPFLRLLMEKAAKGVEVRVIVSKPSKNVSADLEEYFERLGPRQICKYECVRNHAKVVIVDDRMAYIGSANVTRGGLGQPYASDGNFEVGIITDDPQIIASLNERFDSIVSGEFCESCYRKNDCIEY